MDPKLVFSDPDPVFKLFRIQIWILFRILHKVCESVSTSRALRCKAALYSWNYDVKSGSVADPDPGSVPFWPLDPGSGKNISDPQHWKVEIIFFWTFILWSIFKGLEKSGSVADPDPGSVPFWPLEKSGSVADPDPGSVPFWPLDPGSGKNISDPQHWKVEIVFFLDFYFMEHFQGTFRGGEEIFDPVSPYFLNLP